MHESPGSGCCVRRKGNPTGGRTERPTGLFMAWNTKVLQIRVAEEVNLRHRRWQLQKELPEIRGTERCSHLE